MEQVRQAKRPPFKRFIEDPIVALAMGMACGLLWILPLSVSRKTGAFLGGLIYYFAPNRNKIALKNMTIGLPDKTPAEHKEIVKKMWRHFGMVFAESAHGAEVMKKAKKENLEPLKKAIEVGKGGFVCTAHFGNWEFDIGQMISPDFHVNPVYRKANNPWLNKLLFERRAGVKIPKGKAGARLMLDVLNKGGFIAILCDQKLREGVEVPFFGKPAMTASAMASLAIKKKVPIFMVKGVRGKDNRYVFSVTEQVQIPSDLPYQDAIKAIMTHVNEVYWEWIKQNPEQYLWIHRRFERSFYEA